MSGGSADRDSPLADGELVAFPLVGTRPYVRALDVLSLCEARLPELATLTIAFRRPIAPLVRIAAARSAATAAVVTVTRRDRPTATWHIDNATPSDVRRVPDPALCWHLSLKRAGRRQVHLIDGRAAEHRKLEVIFADFQDASGQRYVVRRLALRRVRSLPLDVVTMTHTTEPATGLSTFRMAKNARSWLEVDVIPAAGRGR